MKSLFFGIQYDAVNLALLHTATVVSRLLRVNVAAAVL
jgi:hypothetical protein